MKRAVLIVSALSLAVPVTTGAQSLFNAAGLGVPASAVDARTRALGGVGVGLQGAALLGSDPAAAAAFLLPTAVMTAQPSWVDFDRRDPDESGTFRGTRFPSVGIAYPTVKGFVATFGFESFLDQRYEAASTATILFGGKPVEVRDDFVSTGGVSLIRLGVSRRFGPRVSVGASVGRYGGSVTRRLVRSFGEGVDTTVVEPFQAGGLWSYSGVGVTGGASILLGNVAHLAGSVTWSSGLDATASDDSEGDSRSYDLPLQVRLGATAILAPGLSLSASFSSADFSVTGADFVDGSTAGSVRSWGAGLELSRARLLGRTAPLRLGYRRSDLPFSLDGDAPLETVWSGGLGLNFNQSGDFVPASVDLALERGDRSNVRLSERFWRGTLTVRVSGF